MNKDGRAPSGQALVQAPSPTVSALTGFDPSRTNAPLSPRERQARILQAKLMTVRPCDEDGIILEINRLRAADSRALRRAATARGEA